MSDIPFIKNSMFSAGNVGGSKELFNKKLNYDDSPSLTAARSNVVNFNVGEKLFYGRMNLLEAPISLANNNHIQSTKRGADSTSPVGALKFVTEQFEEMALQFEKDIIAGKIRSDQKFLSNLKAHRGYENPWFKYQEYKNVYFEKLSSKYKKLSAAKQSKNIKHFMERLVLDLAIPSKAIPFTYPSFVKSRFCDIMSTGLAIEIADINYSNDREKAQHFLHSPTWNYYVNACNNFGFLIDYQYPFRLVADINSTVMKNRARSLTRSSGYAILDILYNVSAQVYLPHLARDLVSLYNMSTLEFYYETTVCPHGNIKRVQRHSPRYDIARFFKEIDLNTLIKFYMNMRIIEQKPQMSSNKRQLIINDSIKYFNHTDNLNLPLAVFESIVSSTVDKIGSFSYYKKHVEAVLPQFTNREKMEDERATFEYPVLGFEEPDEYEDLHDHGHDHDHGGDY